MGFRERKFLQISGDVVEEDVAGGDIVWPREKSRKERELVILDDGATRKRAGEIVVLVKQHCACPFKKSVEESSALCRSPEKWDLNAEMSKEQKENGMETNLGVFKGAMIIVGYFVARGDVDLGVDDSFLLSTDGNDFRRAIRVAIVVDELAFSTWISSGRL